MKKNVKKEIIETGLFLLKKGLIARTWGNVSARLNDSEFLITPSGKAYTDIKPADLATVRITDCAYDKKGPKPSSEKKVHAIIYELRPDINYVVHTHQLYASAVCAEGFSVVLPDGTYLPCAKYGIPGTDTLRNHVGQEVYDNPECDMVLMEKHGAVVFGKTMEETLKKAQYLEKQCKILFNNRVEQFEIPEHMDAWIDDYAQLATGNDPVDDEEALKLVRIKNAAAQLYSRDGKPLTPLHTKLQHYVYITKYSKLKGNK